MRAAILDLQEKDIEAKIEPRQHLIHINSQLVLNTGMIFSNGDLADVKKILDSQVREAPARIGSIAPADVTIPAGPTGMDPKQTSFFQALNIQTKIVKGQVEIVNAVKVITTDDKITAGQAALLDKLKIRPFEYKMHIKKVLDGGALYPPAVLSITLDSILEKFSTHAQNLTAISLATGYATSASASHLVLNAFKNLAALSFGSGFGFPAADKLLASASARPAAGAAKSAAPVKVEAAKAPEPEPEVDVDMGDLFGY
jgi:large subunit ribosomal protein LP0